MISKGCPQGPILGPSLWNLVFDILINGLSDIAVEIIPTAYADEIFILIEGIPG